MDARDVAYMTTGELLRLATVIEDELCRRGDELKVEFPEDLDALEEYMNE